MAGYFSMVLIFFVSLTNFATTSPTVNTVDTTIRNLFNRIESLQVKESQKILLPFRWRKDKGVYPSEVKLNFHGPPELALMRDLFKVFDNNMFASAWITTCLIEAYKYGNGPKPTETQISLALGDISSHTDKNRQSVNSIMNFWPQDKNQTVNYWQNTPFNLLALFKVIDDFPMGIIEEILGWMGFTDVENILKMLIKEKGTFQMAFHIPADFDDSFLNIGLGSLLTDLQHDFPDSSNLWRNNNRNLSSVLTALSKYAYRPMSADPKINSIDPRTYFYLREFLDEAASQQSDVALVSTWIQNTQEVRWALDKGVAMPFNINNVDVTVAANTIYGITSGILSGTLEPQMFNSDIQQIYHNTTTMISYEISKNFSSRPDLALTYYPSRYECYWFTARTYALLRRTSQTQQLPFSVMESALSQLGPVFRGTVTSELLNSAHTDSQGRVYYDDFMGDGDLDRNNHTVIKGEDRIFTTSMAVNTLISTWTGFNQSSGRLHWESGTPTGVVKLVSSAVNWLNDFVLSGTYKPWNAFFSGSGKGEGSMPFWFPANRLEYFNGSHVNDTKFPDTNKFIIGFQGIVSKADYDAMIKQSHFGKPTPMDFHGFNANSGFFPFWTSDAYTYATALLALSQYTNIV